MLSVKIIVELIMRSRVNEYCIQKLLNEKCKLKVYSRTVVMNICAFIFIAYILIHFHVTLLTVDTIGKPIAL